VARATVDPDAFNAFEAAGWEEKADGYDFFFGALTSRFAGPLLDAANVTDGTRVLDVATGPGYVARAAKERGAEATGVDIADSMVATARRLHPGVDFRRGDAQRLDFADASFDAVVSNFGVLHLGRPEAAAAEFFRVLRPGGRLAFTVWDLPERMRIIGVVTEAAAEAGAVPPEHVPHGPDIFRFAHEEEAEALLHDAGFEDLRFETRSAAHTVATSTDLWDGLLAGTLRTAIIIQAQPEDVRKRIREAFDRKLEEHRAGDALEVPVAVRLAAGRKPDAG
jgi:SAM-dependent methyltransferase